MRTRHDDIRQGPCDCNSCVIADGLHDIASALRSLGNADAETPMGAIEALGAVLLDAADNIANAIDGLTTGIGDINERT